MKNIKNRRKYNYIKVSDIQASGNRTAFISGPNAYFFGQNTPDILFLNQKVNSVPGIATYAQATIAKDVCAADTTLFFIDINNNVWSFGSSIYGALGNNTVVNTSIPALTIFNGIHNFSQVSGFDSIYGLKPNGELWSWGSDGYAQLGDGSFYNISSPISVVGDHSFIKVSNGAVQSLGLKIDGSTWNWGRNVYGTLGDETLINRSSPVPVHGTHSFITIYCGRESSVGLKSNGTTWTWGYNASGQIGDETITTRSSPVSVHGAHSFIQVTMSNGVGYSSAGLKIDGSCWTWGDNATYGQLGDETVTLRSSPVSVHGSHSFMSIAFGSYHLTGLKIDGSVWSWGRNDYGQLGNETLTAQSSPISLHGDHSFVNLVTGTYHTLGLKIDGSVWDWGRNAGELGDRTNNPRSSPVSVHGAHSFIAISAVGYSSFGLKSDGTLWAWGGNFAGTLGNYEAYNKSSPVLVVGNHSFNSISSGGYYTYSALKSDGSCWAWGLNDYWELGNNPTTNRSSPISVVGNHSFSSVVASNFHTLALKSGDGSVWGWGYNFTGQLGNYNINALNSPTQIVENHSFISISCGYSYSMALKSNGSAWTWGYNTYGVLGDTTVTNRSSPVSVRGAHSFISVASGFYHALALKSDGSVWAWGYNANGVLGNQTTTSYSSPIMVAGSHSFTSIAAGILCSFGLKADGTLWAWGDNTNGILGDGTYISRSSPVSVIGTNFAKVSCSSSSVIILDKFGQVFVGGFNSATTSIGIWGTSANQPYPILIHTTANYKVYPQSYNQISLSGYGVLFTDSNKVPYYIGDNTNGMGGNNSTNYMAVPVMVSGNHSFDVIKTSVNKNISLGLKSDGSAWAWGLNTSGQLGDETLTNKSSPVSVHGAHSFVSIAAEDVHCLGLKVDGTLWAWGEDIYGALASGYYPQVSSPVSVVGGHSFSSLGSDNISYHCLALKSDGSCWAWGRNNSVELGIQAAAGDRYSPVAVRGNHSFIQVVGGTFHSLGLKTNGSCWSWGYNNAGQLGDRTITDKSSPVSVHGAHSFIQIAASASSLGLKVDGSVWAWGNNAYGYLGDETATSRSSPVSLHGNHSFISIAAGFYVSGGLKTDGSAWAWGYNVYGNLGDEQTATNRSSPVSVHGAHSFISISIAVNSMTGLKIDGTCWAWGYNGYGSLGDETTTNRSSPVSVHGAHSFISIKSADNAIIGLKSDGSTWSWGYNIYGYLGDETLTNRSSPVLVHGSHIFNSISMGYAGMGLKSDGSIWTWGYNVFGSLGLNIPAYRSSPVSVIGDHSFTSVIVEYHRSLALKSDGSAWGWGDGGNGAGALGNFTADIVCSPRIVVGNHSFTSLVGGSLFTLCLKSNGSCWTWGVNNGNLGDGSTANKSSPVSVIGNHSFIKIAASGYHTVGLKNDGSVWGWGTNWYGELGLFDGILAYLSPVKLINFTNIRNRATHSLPKSVSNVTISTSEFIILDNLGQVWQFGLQNGLSSFANRKQNDFTTMIPNRITFPTTAKVTSLNTHPIFSDGSAWLWGLNNAGQLGNEKITFSSIPVSVHGNHSFISIKNNNFSTSPFSAGLKIDGSVWEWGANSVGILGDETTTNRSSPVSVHGAHSFISIHINYLHSLGLKIDGSVWSWGYNNYAALGDETLTDKSSPVSVHGNHSFVQISTGIYPTLGLKIDGTLWGWGYNAYGSLGDGTALTKSSPVSVQGNHSFIYVVCAQYHSLGLKIDGSIWGWGMNTNGQLGDETLTNKVSPVPVHGNHSFIQIFENLYVSNPGISMAKKSNGEIWAWGIHPVGIFGINRPTFFESSPILITFDLRV